MKKAVFLDRDGVINRLVPNPESGEYEPPHEPGEISLYPEVIESLKRLQDHGFQLFIVSNQPDCAKGKASLADLQAVHMTLDRIFQREGITFREYWYCYHHPKGTNPGLSFDCECRKPKPYFLKESARKYGIDLSKSWMIGDRDSDIECGKAAGVSTILIEEPCSEAYRGTSNPDHIVKNLKNAVDLITQ